MNNLRISRSVPFLTVEERRYLRQAAKRRRELAAQYEERECWSLAMDMRAAARWMERTARKAA